MITWTINETHHIKTREAIRLKIPPRDVNHAAARCSVLSEPDLAPLLGTVAIKPNLWRRQTEGAAKNIPSCECDIWRKEEGGDTSECEREDTGREINKKKKKAERL